MSLQAYQRARSNSETPREMEARLMRQITGELVAARETGASGLALAPTLFRNRILWNALADACGAQGNQLPKELRAGIVSLGLWVNRFTSEVMVGREPIDPLIEVNFSVIAGLES